MQPDMRERAEKLGKFIASRLPDLKTFDGKLIIYDWHAEHARMAAGEIEAEFSRIAEEATAVALEGAAQVMDGRRGMRLQGHCDNKDHDKGFGIGCDMTCHYGAEAIRQLAATPAISAARERMLGEAREPLEKALREARQVLIVACGEKAPYIRITLQHIDAALSRPADTKGDQ